MQKAYQRFFGWLVSFLAIISGCIATTINFRPLYLFDVHFLKLPEVTGLTQEVIVKNFDILMRFLNNPWQKTMVTPDFVMSASGFSHFVEVKNLFILDYVVFLVCLGPALYFFIKMSKTGQNWRLHSLFKKALVVPLLVAAVMALGFNQFFIGFHQLFFNNNDWMFNPCTDPIINILPEDFFMHCFVLALVLFELVMVVGLVLTRQPKTRRHGQSKHHGTTFK